MRPLFQWQLRSRSLSLGGRTLVMGIVNVTPDSFSDGGEFLAPHAAIEHGLHLLDEGADILDIGGESTRPGKKEPVTEDEESRRVFPVIEGILARVPTAILSIDTYKSRVAAEAIGRGAEIINDVSSFRWDPKMAATVAGVKPGCILMHMRGRPEDWRTQPPDPDIVATVKREMKLAADVAMKAGMPAANLMLDPGFGFGKNFEENYPLLARFAEFQELGFPLLSGTSRKSFIGRTLAQDSHDAPVNERIVGTMATVTASVLAGAHVVRVHDVKQAVETVRIADEILNAQAG
ncbi:MAG TPA: dihydropteroate synthase [Terriglobales bacterium]|nr:dihydropteroate synthase [Terriglobales bacterium]